MPVDGGGARVEIKGLKELRRDLGRVEPELKKGFNQELKTVADVVVRDARSRVPVRTGAARDSIRAVSGGNAIFIKAGKARVPYYGWLDFGGVLERIGGRRNTQRRRKKKHGRYIYPAIAANERQLVRAAQKVFDRARRRANL